MATLCVLFSFLLLILATTATREVAGPPLPKLSWNLHALSLLIMGVALATSRIWYDSISFLGDYWTVAEAVHKTQQGLLSSRDYFSPIGPVQNWVYALSLLIHPPSARSLVLANVIVAAFSLLFTVVLLRKRASPLTIAAAGLLAVTTALTPRDIDLTDLQANFLAPYNRWPWALLVPVALRAALPLVVADTAGAALLGVAIALLLLTKVTYGAAAILTLGLAVILQPRQWKEGAFAAAGFVAVMVIADLLTHGQIRAYFHDLHDASAIPGNRVRIRKLLLGFTSFPAFAIGSALLMIAATRSDDESPLRSIRQYWRGLVLACAVGSLGLVVLMQNFYNTEATTLLVMPLIVAEWTGLFARLNDRPGGLWHRGGELVAIVLVVVLARPALDAGMVIAQPMQQVAEPPLPALAGTEFHDLLFDPHHLPDATGACADITCQDYSKMLAGRDLLRKACLPRPGRSILAANFANPFPALMGVPSPRASPIWLHENRSFSLNIHLPADRMLSDVDCLLEAQGDPNSALFMTLYGTDVNRDFRAVGEDKYWRLWRRK